MQLPLKPFAVLAIVLAQGADSSSVLAGTDMDTTFGNSRQIDLYEEYSYSYSSICELDYIQKVEIRGYHSSYVLRDLPDHSLIDARSAIFQVDARKAYIDAIIVDGGRSLCWIGGEVAGSRMGNNDKRSSRSRTSSIRIQHFAPYASVAIYNLRLRGGANGLLLNEEIDSIVWERGAIYDLTDSCMSLAGFAIAILRRSLFDGCSRLLEVSEDVNYETIVLESNVIRVDSSSEVGFIHFEEQSPLSIELHNNVILFEEINQDELEYLHNIILLNVESCWNNIFIFPEMDPAEEIQTDCGLITYDRTIWEAAKNTWLDLYSDNQSSFDSGTVATSGAPNRNVADGLRTARSSHEFDAIEAEDLVAEMQSKAAEARDVLSESRTSVQEAIAAAQRAARAVDSFLGRWSDETFWLDGTGWVE